MGEWTVPSIFQKKSATMKFLVLLLPSVLAASAAAPALPSGLEWRRVRSRDLYVLLRDSYVAEGDFRLHYRRRMLRWLLHTPGTDRTLQVGIGRMGERELLACVCAIPTTLSTPDGTRKHAIEVSMLCVRRDWRSRGLTRLALAALRVRALARGVECAIFTGARPLPRITAPILSARCYHRPLRARALIKSGFWDLSVERGGGGVEGGISYEAAMAAADAMVALPTLPKGLPNPHPLRPADVKSCHRLLVDRMSRCFFLSLFPICHTLLFAYITPRSAFLEVWAGCGSDARRV